jgi:hypothetical protein
MTMTKTLYIGLDVTRKNRENALGSRAQTSTYDPCRLARHLWGTSSSCRVACRRSGGRQEADCPADAGGRDCWGQPPPRRCHHPARSADGQRILRLPVLPRRNQRINQALGRSRGGRHHREGLLRTAGGEDRHHSAHPHRGWRRELLLHVGIRQGRHLPAARAGRALCDGRGQTMSQDDETQVSLYPTIVRRPLVVIVIPICVAWTFTETLMRELKSAFWFAWRAACSEIASGRRLWRG